MPGLRKLTGEAEVVGPVKIRPADLYVTHDHVQPGVVLVGDAFGTSCPAAGTGTSKVFTDVERLCNVYIPQWLASDGMGVDKIGAFYADPVKNACDRHSFDKAFTPALDVDRPRPVLARAPLGALPRPPRHRHRAPVHGAAAGACRRRAAMRRRASAPPRSFPCTSDNRVERRNAAAGMIAIC